MKLIVCLRINRIVLRCFIFENFILYKLKDNLCCSFLEFVIFFWYDEVNNLLNNDK